jgi:hypothetical protein
VLLVLSKAGIHRFIGNHTGLTTFDGNLGLFGESAIMKPISSPLGRVWATFRGVNPFARQTMDLLILRIAPSWQNSSAICGEVDLIQNFSGAIPLPSVIR